MVGKDDSLTNDKTRDAVLVPVLCGYFNFMFSVNFSTNLLPTLQDFIITHDKNDNKAKRSTKAKDAEDEKSFFIRKLFQ